MASAISMIVSILLLVFGIGMAFISYTFLNDMIFMIISIVFAFCGAIVLIGGIILGD